MRSEGRRPLDENLPTSLSTALEISPYTIPFPNNSKAASYFIQFAKYQNYIHWDNHLLRKVVKDALLSRIRDELHFSHENISSFKGLKKAVLRIDNDFWKRQQENKNKF